MSETQELHDWIVHVKGLGELRVLQAHAPVTSPDGVSFVSFSGDDGQVKAMFPTNAVAAVGRAPREFGSYPVDVAPEGGHLRNIKTDGTGHWVPYTGPLFGIKE